MAHRRPMTTDKRKQRRLRTLQGGRIVFNWAASTIDCTIRDLSNGGARLRFAVDYLEPPAAFELMVVPAGFRVPARVAWLRGPEVGVASG